MTLCNGQLRKQRRGLILAIGIVVALAFAGAVGVGGASNLAHADTPAQDEEAEFVVSIEGVEEADSGSTVLVNVTVEPTEELGEGADRTKKIDWFELPVEYQGLELDAVEEATFGSVEVDGGGASVFLDSDEELRAADAPLTLATLEFRVTGEDGDEASVAFGDGARIGWGPDWLRAIPVFQHETSFEGTTIDVVTAGDKQNTFQATNTGGYIVLGQEGDTPPAPDNRTAFSAGSVEIEAVVDNGTWVSTDVAFPTIEAANGTIEFDLGFPNGLSGEIDPDADRLTADGELAITPSVSNQSATFDVRLTTGDSGALAGSANLTADGGSATLVDNEFSFRGACILELPFPSKICLSGANWLQLPLEIEVVEPAPEQFEAANTGGYIGSAEYGEDGPPENPARLPPGSVEIDAVVDNGTWESTDVAFPTLGSNDSQLISGTSFPEGLSGTIDPAADYMTANGTLAVAAGPANETASYEIRATTGRSGELNGSANLDTDGGTVRLVDNQFTLEGCQIFFPPCVESQNYLELPLEIDFDSGSEAGTFSVEVIDSIGRPIENATVTTGGEPVLTDENGRAQIPIDSDTVAVVVEAYGARTTVENPQPADTYQQVRLDALPPFLTGFEAVGQGGYLAFDAENATDARENGASLSEGLPVFHASLENGTWETDPLDFGAVDFEYLYASVTAPDGLSGTIDQATGRLTATGTLSVDVAQASTFSFEIDATTGESGALSGSSELDSDGATVTLVDNEFVVEEGSGNAFVDAYLGLPATEPGTNWFELRLSLSNLVVA